MDATVILYRHFDGVGRLLYVGIANNAKRRLIAHGSEKAPWFSAVAHSTYERFPNRKKAAQAEIQVIKSESPLWNVAHNKAPIPKILCPVQIPKLNTKPIIVLFPSEPCFARKGVLVSFLTGGRADHIECELINDGRGDRFNYLAVLEWMEWFGYHYASGRIVSKDDSVRAYWIDALNLIGADWEYEFVHRPKLGLEFDIFPLRL